MIKKLTNKNVKDIMVLHKKAIFPLWKKLKRAYTVNEIQDYVKYTLKKGNLFGLFDGKELIGCGGIVLDKKTSYGDIQLVLVEPKFQGKGIGKKLMKHLEKYAKGKVKRTRLHVLVENKALGFYEKLNYKKHAYIMEKKI